MAINVTWDGTTYSIPQSGEFNWSSLTNFLVALGQKAAVAGEMKQEIRKATTSPVTISAASDYAVVTDLTVAGPVTVNLPGGSPGQIFVIVDGKADAATNNITINRAGADTIIGQTSLVMNKDRQVVMLQYNSSDTDWKVINYAIPPGQVTDSDISGVISTAGKVSGDAITSGTIAGSTSLNSSGSVTLTGSGALSVAGTAALNGGVTLGDQAADALTINSSAASIPNGLNFDSNTLVIDATLNRVGIGTASPSQALDVVGTVNATTVAAATVNAGALNASGNTALGDASSDVLTINGTAVTIPNGLNIDSNTLVIDAANNRVGVGIAAPTVALDVVGAAKVSTNLNVGGSATLGDSTSDSHTIYGDVSMVSTGAIKISSGDNSQRPGVPVNGMIRYSTEQGSFEGYASGAWSAIGGGGTVDKVNQVGHGFVVGDVLRVASSNVYTKAIATAANTAEVVGVVSRVIGSSDFEITLNGEVSGFSSLIPGTVYFLSDTTAGLATDTEPTTVGYVSVPVGVATTPTTMYVAPKRGVVVGGANARTQISLLNNTANQPVQNVSSYDAGELAGWVYIDATTDLRFYVQAQFVRGGDNNYDISYQVSGDTPPAGFLMSITNAGVIQITMPNIAGVFTSASINYALNAPAVGTNFPLSVDGSAVTAATATAPGVVSVTTQTFAGEKIFNNGITVKTGQVEVGLGRVSDGDAYVDLTTQTSETDFNARLLRSSGTNGTFKIDQKGTGIVAIDINSVQQARFTSGGELYVAPNNAVPGNAKLFVLGVIDGRGYLCRAGTNGASSNTFNIFWTGSAAQLWIDTTNAGTLAFTSDYRIKREVQTLETPSLDRVMRLRPVTYKIADYGNIFKEQEEVWEGFIAHEVKEVIPSGVTGEKDAENELQSLKLDSIVAVLTKAIQELKAELDAVKSELAALK